MTKIDFPVIDLNVPEEEKPKELTEDEVLEEAKKLIASQMPRIHKMIELMWGYPKEFDDWIEKMWLDDRGDRQGFPPPVMSALTKIHNIHIKRFGTITKKGDDVWCSNQKLY